MLFAVGGGFSKNKNNTGKEADSVSYICGSEGFSAEQNGRITALESGENCAAVTAEV